VTLLDETDRTRRRLQHGAILVGILLLLVTLGLLDPAVRPWGIASLAAGFSLLGAATRIDQEWSVDYKGHRVRYVNNPILGEKLFIDGERAGTGKIGIRSEIRAPIKQGDGAGDVIVARTTAGLMSFRCVIDAEPANPADAVPPGLTDAVLLQEVRRRGLG
jgi:hypothetical protein